MVEFSCVIIWLLSKIMKCTAHNNSLSVSFSLSLSLSHSSTLSLTLSCRLLSSLSLRKLLAGNNRLQSLPDLLDHVPLEALDLQHNKLAELPESFFYKALK